MQLRLFTLEGYFAEVLAQFSQKSMDLGFITIECIFCRCFSPFSLKSMHLRLLLRLPLQHELVYCRKFGPILSPKSMEGNLGESLARFFHQKVWKVIQQRVQPDFVTKKYGRYFSREFGLIWSPKSIESNLAESLALLCRQKVWKRIQQKI